MVDSTTVSKSVNLSRKIQCFKRGLRWLSVLVVRLDPKTKQQMSVGTFCTGTDCAIQVIQSFLDSCKRTLGIPDQDMPRMRHLFSCEKHPQNREFLEDFCPSMEKLYQDVLEPVHMEAAILSAGFPRDDASALHPNSSSEKHRLCVSQDHAVRIMEQNFVFNLSFGQQMHDERKLIYKSYASAGRFLMSYLHHQTS